MSFFLLFLIIICCLYIATIQKRGGSTWLLSPPILMSAYFLLVALPGILLVADPWVREKALIAHLLWMLGVLLSCFLFGQRIVSKVPADALRYYHAHVPTYYLFILIGLLAFVATFILFGRAPLLIALDSLFGSGGDGLTMHQARQMNTLENRNGDTIYFGVGYLRQIYTVLSPVFCAALYLHFRVRLRQKAPLFVLFLMAFFVFAGAMNGQIWVAANIIIIFLLTKYLADIFTNPDFDSLKLLYRGAMAYAFLIAFVFAYRYLQYTQGRAFQDFTVDTLNRIYSYKQADLFALFGEQMPFRYGSTWINDLAGVLPGSIQSFSYEVNYLIYGTSGFTLAPGIVLSSYVNFGYIGVFIMGFILTAIFSVVFNRLIKSRSILSLTFAIYVSFSFFIGLAGDLNSYLVSLLTVFLIHISYRILNILLVAWPRHSAVRT